MIDMLRRERRFSVLLAGNAMSQIGDGVHEFVFVITVLHAAHNNVALAGIVYFFRFIPYLVLGPLGGALSDRLPRRALMVFADLSRAVTTGLFCVLLAIDRVDLVSLGLIGMAMTSFRTLFQPAFQGTIPAIVKTEHLPAANGATQMAAEMGGLVGPALGGIMLAAVGNPGFVLIIDAATYLLSTLCVWCAIAAHMRDDATLSQEKLTIRSLYGDFGQNLQGALQKRELFVTIGYSALCILFVGSALRILIPALLKGSGYADSMVGYAMSFIAFGALAGAVVCSKVMQRFDTRNLMLYWSMYGIALAILPACVVSTPTIFAGCFVLGAIGAFADVILPTNIQNLSTDANVGKNFSLFSTLANTSEALSGGLAGLLTLISPVGGSLVITGLLIASVAYLGKIRVEV
ncbi:MULTISPECIES: MFS transporter [Burkholderia]|uniref:Enterobactin exporter EntS n=1 Tax=Burkholderia aenigmatica TaxID=2015348 RepID=A0A6J5IPZ5_9BURK|nr:MULTISPECIES: MFS transporter [Burkholderia]CAB3962420.1 Enterobactin exporter EntS [Burkholderia aenigmatica]